MKQEVDRLHFRQVLHDNNMIVIVIFIICILSCFFFQWGIRLKILFICKNPMEIYFALSLGVSLNIQFTSSFDFGHILFD